MKHCITAAFGAVLVFVPTVVFIPDAAAAEDAVIDSLVIAGIDSATVSEASPLLLSRKGEALNDGLLEHDIGALETFMRERGWWNALASVKIDSLRIGGVALVFLIDPGKPVYFGRIGTTGADMPFPDILPGESSLYGGLFSRSALEETISGIVSGIAASGYPDITITPSLKAAGDTVDVLLSIIPGARASIDSIAVSGLTRTQDIVIRRELAFLLGNPAGEDAVDRAVGALAGLGFVRTTGRPVMRYENGRGVLAVALEEGNQGVFDGALGYQPDAEGNGGGFIGKIDFALDNLFGTGRAAGFRWENLGEGTEDLEVNYREPWILGKPYSAGISFTQEERGLRGYTRTVMAATLGRSIGRLALDVGFRYEKVSADSIDSSSGAGFEGTAAWTSVDNRLNPSRGIRYGASWSSVSKRYRFGGRENTRIDRIGLDFDHYIPTANRQAAAVLLRYRSVSIPDEHLTASDRYWLGGATTIRGHGESMYPAAKAFWGTAEYRFITGEDSRVFVFVDSGWLADREKSAGKYKNTTDHVTGYGFGLRLTSRAGILGFDYGLAQGDGPGDGKIHVSMRTEF